MRKFFGVLFVAIVAFSLTSRVSAAPFTFPDALPESEDATIAAQLASEAARLASQAAQEDKRSDVTKPEEPDEREDVFKLFTRRPALEPTLTNFIAFGIQYSVRSGVPANTIILIMLLPVLATIVAFFRHVIGLPSLGLLVPIALSITLLATGITAGIALLITIIFASTLARFLLKRIRIMQLPKMALSVFIVSLFVFVTLTIIASIGLLTVQQLSIFPILLLILLSERIVAIQLERSTLETIPITLTTLGLGVLGFFVLSSETLRNIILLYPELLFMLVPINIIIGRYFGLRFTEYYRFTPIIKNGRK